MISTRAIRINKQQGVTLLISLLVLIVATLIAIYAMKSTTFQLKMSNNERVLAKTYWCSKSLLDYYYEKSFRTISDKDSVFSKAFAKNGDLETDYDSALSWNTRNPTQGISGFVPQDDFAMMYTQNATLKPEGYDQTFKTYGFEMQAHCKIAGSGSKQVYGVSALGFQSPGSLIE